MSDEITGLIEKRRGNSEMRGTSTKNLRGGVRDYYYVIFGACLCSEKNER